MEPTGEIRAIQYTPVGNYRVTRSQASDSDAVLWAAMPGDDSYWDACKALAVSTAPTAPKFFRKVGL